MPTEWCNVPPNLKELFLKIICAQNQDNVTWSDDIPEICDILREAAESVKEVGVTGYAFIDDKTRELRDFYGEIREIPSIEGLQGNIREIIRENEREKFSGYPSKTDWQLREACWDFMEYQINAEAMSGGNFDEFKREGFQIGSPWHGDVMKAPVLFIGSNPNVNKNCIFPRWHYDKSPEFEFTLGGEETSFEEIYKFLRDRLVKNINNKGRPCAKKIKDGQTKTYEVPYWRGMSIVMKEIASSAKIGSADNPIQRAEKLMRSVLSAEVIFFGSKHEIYAKNSKRLLYFWKTFVLPLLTGCAAKVVVLSGDKAQDTFSKSAGDELSKIFGGVYYWNPAEMKKDFVVIYARHFSGSNEKKYKKTAEKLLKVRTGKNPKAAQIIEKMIDSIRNIYTETECEILPAN